MVVGWTRHDNKKLGVQGFLAVCSRAQDSECQQFGIVRHWLTCLTQKAPCANNFRAIKQAMRFSKACDITGIVSVACTRHGCFAPNSIVDLFRGEQQKNVDWSFLECIRTTNVDSEQGIMLIYDIICQYLGHSTGNPWVTQPVPAPTPALNPYPCSWVWVPAAMTHGYP